MIPRVDGVIAHDYSRSVTCGELRRWLRKQGCQFVEGKRTTKVVFRGRVASLPRHSSTEMKKGTVEAILKALGLKGE